MKHRFTNTRGFVPGAACEICGAELDNPAHDVAEKAETAPVTPLAETLRAERDVAIGRVRELYRALSVWDGCGNILTDIVLAEALEKISSLRNHARVADETVVNFRREHDLAKTRVAMLRHEVDSQCRKNDEAYVGNEHKSQRMWDEAVGTDNADLLIQWFRDHPDNRWLPGSFSANVHRMINRLCQDGRLIRQRHKGNTLSYTVNDPAPYRQKIQHELVGNLHFAATLMCKSCRSFETGIATTDHVIPVAPPHRAEETKHPYWRVKESEHSYWHRGIDGDRYVTWPCEAAQIWAHLDEMEKT